jgi:valyl-tRNA synthetase
MNGAAKTDDNNSDNWICGKTLEEATLIAEKKFNTTRDNFTLVQDDDVLDTWFSSALFPFAVCGWPEKTKDMQAFFPNSILETGHDILFFWVAKMVIMSYYLCDKQLPYKKVFLHSMVRDESGEKMSKSKGNVIDPLEVIDGCDLETILAKITESTLSDKEKQKSTAYKKKKFALGIP